MMSLGSNRTFSDIVLQNVASLGPVSAHYAQALLLLPWLHSTAGSLMQFKMGSGLKRKRAIALLVRAGWRALGISRSAP